MDVVNTFPPKVWHGDLAAFRQVNKYGGVEITHRIERYPPAAHQVTRMEDGCRESIAPGGREQIALNGFFPDPVFTEWLTLCVFGDWHLRAYAVYPDGAAMEKMADLSP